MTSQSRILVVDDDEQLLDTVVEYLTVWGYRVLSARDGPEALRMFEAERPELVITDLIMPGMSGLEVTKAVKAIAPDTEIVILTGHSTVASAIDALRAGASDYFLKPVNFAELEEGTKRVLEHYRLAEENRTLLRTLEEHVQRQREQLTAGQQRLLAVFSAIPDALLIVDRELTIVEANEGVTALGGIPARELIGRNWHRVLFAEEETCPGCPLLEVFATGRPASVSMSREGLSGRRDLEVRGFPLASGTGAIHEAVVHIRDVTEFRRAEEERLALSLQRNREDAMRVLGRLTAGIAHDFNNQLTVIKGCAQFLLDAMRPDAPGRDDAERISATVERGARLVRQLLAFSRQQKIQPRSLNLAELAHEMAPLLRPALGEQVVLRARAAPGLWRVHADPGQIEQVIMNLVVNARDAMTAGAERQAAGTLTVEVVNIELDDSSLRPVVERTAPGPYVLLAVSDTGSGIAPEVQRHIFEPFFTTKGPGQGTGLGLSTVFGIVKQHRGYVVCESEPGRGSTFRVYLPRDQAGEEAPAEAAAVPAAPTLLRGETLTALVVEDDEAVRDVVRRGLEEVGYRVYTAGNAEEALAVSATAGGAIRLLVADLVLAGGSGRAVAERLRAGSPTLKVLFISGYFDATLGGPELPGMAFLQKPFSPSDLARKAREILGGGGGGGEPQSEPPGLA